MFTDSGSVSVEMLRQYDTLSSQAATRWENTARPPPHPLRCIMWLNWGFMQFLPPVIAIFFLVDLHKTAIPRIYNESAFPVQVLLWVSMTVTSFCFYASSWIPPGRVSEREQGGRRAPNTWRACKLCRHDVPPIARHCQVCRMCIWERDHHCFFIGNCVGRDNINAFNLLCILTAACGFLYLAVVMGGAVLRERELQHADWILGFICLSLLLGCTHMYLYVRNRRTRMVQRFPIFFE
ncbi:probable protein S-acyltransferase 16 [Portunus trituberculatus]|uniref:probable protein S-acyltransferase 16 n=1 Tax=Portunus trituberculatus TaxID=210409 RepID=UPI001E1D13AD|nr:probable protein S-acyltransferase 16 [Portunus trituberculatus]